jgi:hypothetical protein
MNDSSELARFVNCQELEISSDTTKSETFFRCETNIINSPTPTEIFTNTPNELANEINKIMEEMKLLNKQFNDNLLKLTHLYNLFTDSVETADMQ